MSVSYSQRCVKSVWYKSIREIVLWVNGNALCVVFAQHCHSVRLLARMREEEASEGPIGGTAW